MPNLNEDIFDDLGDLTSSLPSVSDIISSGKRKVKKPGVVRQIVTQQIPAIKLPQISEPVIPTPLADQHLENVVSQISEVSAKETLVAQLKKESKTRSKSKNKKQQLTPEVFQQQNIEAKQALQQVATVINKTGEAELPDAIDYVTLEENIDDALTEIPNGPNVDLSDIEVVIVKSGKERNENGKIDKTGYYKTKVSFKKSGIPEQINIISTLIKGKSNGVIVPREVDFRVIANTNKTQLRGSALKLMAQTVVYKPDPAKLKVNKGTRIMITIPENYASTGNLLIYAQESRAKKIFEISPIDFANTKEFNLFVADRIVEYYNEGYDVSMKKFILRNTDNTLMKVGDVILKTREFKLKPHLDGDNKLFRLDFESVIHEENKWLIVSIDESAELSGTYDIYARNKVDSTWEYKINKQALSLSQLVSKFYDLLLKTYAKDWTAELGINDDDDKFMYFFGLVTHNRLKKALIRINEHNQQIKTEIDNADLVPIEILKVFTKTDTAKLSKHENYDAEAVIGKVNGKQFILSYMAIAIEGGGKRSGKEFIDTNQYREKYHVTTSKEIDARVKTGDRNYHAREYMFVLELISGKNKQVYKDKSFENLFNKLIN